MRPCCLFAICISVGDLEDCLGIPIASPTDYWSLRLLRGGCCFERSHPAICGYASPCLLRVRRSYACASLPPSANFPARYLGKFSSHFDRSLRGEGGRAASVLLLASLALLQGGRQVGNCTKVQKRRSLLFALKSDRFPLAPDSSRRIAGLMAG